MFIPTPISRSEQGKKEDLGDEKKGNCNIYSSDIPIRPFFRVSIPKKVKKG